MSMSKLAWMATLAMALTASGCEDDETSPLGSDAGASDAAGGDVADAVGEASAGGCALAGSWQLDLYRCGEFDITSSWKASVDSSVVTFTEAAGGGCEVLVTHTAGGCEEQETLSLSASGGDQWSGTSQGITSCEPAGCSFNEDDAACELGDRAGPVSFEAKIEDGRLIIDSGEQGVCAGVGDAHREWMAR